MAAVADCMLPFKYIKADRANGNGININLNCLHFVVSLYFGSDLAPFGQYIHIMVSANIETLPQHSIYGLILRCVV